GCTVPYALVGVRAGGVRANQCAGAALSKKARTTSRQTLEREAEHELCLPRNLADITRRLRGGGRHSRHCEVRRTDPDVRVESGLVGCAAHESFVHAARAHRLRAAALRRQGRHDEAAHAEADAVRLAARSPWLVEAAAAMRGRQVNRAEGLLRAHLDADPDDPQALRMLAEIAAVCGRPDEAERLLRKALGEAPGFVPLYLNLAALLHDLGRTDEAIALLDEVLASAPDNGMVLSFKAEILSDAGRMDEALETHETLLALAPGAAVAWANYGRALNVVGRAGEAVGAYRRSLRQDPASGFAWWGLANLKETQLDEHDVPAMRAALDGAGD